MVGRQVEKRSVRRRLPAAAPLALLLAGGLVLRVVLAHRNTFPSVDGVFYLKQAQSLASGQGLLFSNFPPGWPLLASLPLLFGDASDPAAALRAAQLANVLFGTALGWLGWRMLRAEAGRWPALLGAAALLLLPQAIRLSTGDLSDLSYACAMVAAWLLLRRGPGLLAGLTLGYAYLIRPEALLVVAGLGAVGLVQDRRLPWRLLLGASLPILPYLVFIRLQLGQWSLFSKSGFLEEVLRSRQGLDLVGHYLQNSAVHFPLAAGLLGVPLVLLAVLGAVARPGRWLVFLLPMLLPPVFDFAMASRYWLPLLPFLLLGAVRGAGWLAERAPPPRRRLASAALAAVAAGGLAVASLEEARGLWEIPESYHGLKQAGEWLRGRVTPTTRIASYKPYPAFWAGCEFAQIPAGGGPLDVIAWCRREGVEYLVVNVHVAHTLRPALIDLLQAPLPQELAAEVTLVQLYTFEDSYRHNTAVYRLDPRRE